MAMAGVPRPGHAQMRSLCIEESAKFYFKVMGLIETGDDVRGRVYFKSSREREYHSMTRDTTIYDFFTNGNRREAICGRNYAYLNQMPTKWLMNKVGATVFNRDSKLNDCFLAEVT